MGRPTRLSKQIEGMKILLFLCLRLSDIICCCSVGGTAHSSKLLLNRTVGADGSEFGARHKLPSATSDSKSSCESPLGGFSFWKTCSPTPPHPRRFCRQSLQQQSHKILLWARVCPPETLHFCSRVRVRATKNQGSRQQSWAQYFTQE